MMGSGSGRSRHEHGPLHLVSVWARDQGLMLGQREVDGKSNEITAVPELLDALHLDAMGCQTDDTLPDPCIINGWFLRHGVRATSST